MNFPTASSGVSLYNVTYFRLKRRGIEVGLNIFTYELLLMMSNQ
jgi:hypothetical protein